jgi:hypothetical protein
VPFDTIFEFFHQDWSRSKRIRPEKTKPESIDLPEEVEERRTSSLRRVPTVAIYTLAAFTAQDLAHQALANGTKVGITNQPSNKEAGNLVVPSLKEQLQSKEATPIASPESLVAQEFTEGTLPTLNSSTQPKPAVVSTVASAIPPATSAAIAPPETETTMASTASTKLAKVQIQSAQDLQNVSSAKPLPTNLPQTTEQLVAQNIQPETTQPCLEVDGLRSQLRDLEKIKTADDFQASPALSIAIPTGFGVDNNTGFVSATYQQRTRYSNVSDGALGVGVGLGDARKAVGVELSYTAASFGGSRDFGAGGFNVKVHRQLADDLSVAAGWNGFVNVGGPNDFENSVYGTVTKVLRTRDDINLPFSRVAVTAGIGNGQFRSENAVAKGSDGVNIFGNVAVRVAKPVSLIAEWSGQDLGVGVSIAPFKNIPLVITPAVRDIIGAGDGPRFVLGTGLAFKF